MEIKVWTKSFNLLLQKINVVQSKTYENQNNVNVY